MESNNLHDMSLYGHLDELRKSLLISVVALIIMSSIVYAFFLDSLLVAITRPIANLDLNLVLIGVTEAFLVRLKAAVLGGAVLASPIIIWQILRFIFPALHENEKRTVLLIVLSGTILFLCGVVFSYFVILEITLKLMLITFSSGLQVSVSLEKYISFITMMLLPFGLVFEIPVVAFILTRMGILTPAFMIKNRKYVILGAFILAAVLTPPDVISQVILAIPIILFYEISILIAKVAKPQKREEESEACPEL